MTSRSDMPAAQRALSSRLTAAREAARFVCARRHDVALYSLLADCMAICRECEATGRSEEMRQLALDRLQRDAIGRRYLERDPDIYLIVGRYVFEADAGRAACWRYIATLREAAKRQIAPADLAGWLAENGGINALFRARPVAARSVRTRTLHLTDAVEVPRNGIFTLRLKRAANGFFDVVALEDQIPAPLSP